MPDDKLSEFWESLPWTEDHRIAWPEDAKMRETLAEGLSAGDFSLQPDGELIWEFRAALTRFSRTWPDP